MRDEDDVPTVEQPIQRKRLSGAMCLAEVVVPRRSTPPGMLAVREIDTSQMRLQLVNVYHWFRETADRSNSLLQETKDLVRSIHGTSG